VHRLREILVGTEFQRAIAIFTRPLGGDHHDWNILDRLVPPDQTDQLEPVHHGHVDVDERDVERLARDLAQPVHAVMRFDEFDVTQTSK
jgi:hypothetical protein